MQIRQHVFSLIVAADESLRSRPITTEQELCTLFGVSRGTVRKALQMLVDEGLLVRRPHYGTFVHPELFDLTERLPIVGVIVGSGDSTYLDYMALDLLGGVQQALIGRNWGLRTIHLFGNPEKTLAAEVRGKLIGILWLWLPERMAPLRDRLRADGTPVVSVFPNAACIDGHTVNLDYEDYGYQFTRRLIERGCPDLLFVDWLKSAYTERKQRGIARAYRSAGLPWDPADYVHTTQIDARRALAERCRLRPGHRVVGCSGESIPLQHYFPELEFIAPSVAGAPARPNRFGLQPLLPTRAMGRRSVGLLERILADRSDDGEPILYPAVFAAGHGSPAAAEADTSA